MSNCPTCNNPVSPVHVKVDMGWGFDGLLCGKCRKIWAATDIDKGIDMRMLT